MLFFISLCSFFCVNLTIVTAVCPPELEEMCRNIVKKCEGLPLAIVAIGGLLSKKKNGGLEWKKVHDCLATELKSNDHLGSLRRILQLSYDNLPYYLKQCYLYLSVFPEDYLIKLIRLWIVERFVVLGYCHLVAIPHH